MNSPRKNVPFNMELFLETIWLIVSSYQLSGLLLAAVLHWIYPLSTFLKFYQIFFYFNIDYVSISYLNYNSNANYNLLSVMKATTNENIQSLSSETYKNMMVNKQPNFWQILYENHYILQNTMMQVTLLFLIVFFIIGTYFLKRSKNNYKKSILKKIVYYLSLFSVIPYTLNAMRMFHCTQSNSHTTSKFLYNSYITCYSIQHWLWISSIIPSLLIFYVIFPVIVYKTIGKYFTIHFWKTKHCNTRLSSIFDLKNIQIEPKIRDVVKKLEKKDEYLLVLEILSSQSLNVFKSLTWNWNLNYLYMFGTYRQNCIYSKLVLMLLPLTISIIFSVQIHFSIVYQNVFILPVITVWIIILILYRKSNIYNVIYLNLFYNFNMILIFFLELLICYIQTDVSMDGYNSEIVLFSLGCFYYVSSIFFLFFSFYYASKPNLIDQCFELMKISNEKICLFIHNTNQDDNSKCMSNLINNEYYFDAGPIIYPKRYSSFYNNSYFNLNLHIIDLLSAVFNSTCMCDEFMKITPLLSPVYKLSQQIMYVNVCMRSCESAHPSLHLMLQKTLDDLIILYNTLSVVSLFSSSIKDSIKVTAHNFISILPQFTNRLEIRNYELLFVNPIKRRLLLKMFCVASFLNLRKV